MKKKILCLMTCMLLLLSFSLSVAASENENLASITFEGEVTDVSGSVVSSTGDGEGIIKIILNFGEKEVYVDLDGTQHTYFRSDTVSTFSQMTEEEIPEDLTAEQIQEIYGDEYDIEEDEAPVIVITGYDIMAFANDLVDRTSKSTTTEEKADEYTITGVNYLKGLIVDLACQMSERHETSASLLKAFDKELIDEVKETIVENTDRLQARLEEKTEDLQEELKTLEEGSSEYKEVEKELQETEERLEKSKEPGYNALSNYSPLTILDISMNSKARAMMEEMGYLRLYIKIAGVDYEDELVIVNTHPSSEQDGLDAIVEAEKADKKLTDKQISAILDECSVMPSEVVAGAISPDGTVREIPLNDIETAELAEDEVLQPRVRVEISKTSPFLVLMRTEDTEKCALCHNREASFFHLCMHCWLWILLALVVLIIVILVVVKVIRNKKKKEKLPEKSTESGEQTE